MISPRISISLLIFALFGSLCYGCSDSFSYCRYYKSYCKTNKWVRDNCQKTCGCAIGGASWTTCTKTCGSGSRYKETCSGSQCKREYESCNQHRCSTISCRYGYEQRKGLPHACCSKNSNDIGCGLPHDSRRIVYGQHANFREWPWVVALRYWEGLTNKELCGGGLISNKYVLTAAHCFDHYSLKTRWRAYPGILQLSDAPANGGIRINEIYKRYGYNFPHNDIALVELKQTVSTTASIHYICLPRGEVTPEDTTCFVAGWGRSHHPGQFTNHQQEATLKIVNPRICSQKLSPVLPSTASFLASLQGYICAGGTNGWTDTCSGDSGSPLVCQRCSTCTWYVAAIVSFGHPTCGTYGHPAVYTKVLDHESWIKSITRSYTSNLPKCTYSKIP